MNLIKQSLSDQIYDILKLEILKSEIPFGSKLVNRTLQKRFGVSSSPIRDAINRLYQDGLISSIDNTGANVVDFNYEFFLEINEILLHVIKTGIILSAEKSNKDEVASILDKYILLQEDNIQTEEFYDYDYKFHKTFIDFSNNTRLEKLFKEYNVLHEMLVRNTFYFKSPEMKKESIETHKKISDAYKNGNYSEALRLTEEHYKEAENLFKNILKQRENEVNNVKINQENS